MLGSMYEYLFFVCLFDSIHTVQPRAFNVETSLVLWLSKSIFCFQFLKKMYKIAELLLFSYFSLSLLFVNWKNDNGITNGCRKLILFALTDEGEKLSRNNIDKKSLDFFFFCYDYFSVRLSPRLMMATIQISN